MKDNNHVNLRVPTPLRAYTDRQASLELAGTTVGEAMANLIDRYPTLHKHLYDEDGVLRSFVNLYLNGEDIRHLDGVETALAPGDKLAIIPAIAGGAEPAKGRC